MDPSIKNESGYFKAVILDQEIVECEFGEEKLGSLLQSFRYPAIVLVDAPLSPPYRGLRSVEKVAMKKLGARFLPGGVPAMRALASLGLSLMWFFVENGSIPIETHPGSIRLILDLSNIIAKSNVNDAFIAGMAGYCLLIDSAILISDRDGVLLFPMRKCRNYYIKIFNKCFEATS